MHLNRGDRGLPRFEPAVEGDFVDTISSRRIPSRRCHDRSEDRLVRHFQFMPPIRSKQVDRDGFPTLEAYGRPRRTVLQHCGRAYVSDRARIRCTAEVAWIVVRPDNEVEHVIDVRDEPKSNDDCRQNQDADESSFTHADSTLIGDRGRRPGRGRAAANLTTPLARSIFRS